LMTGAIPRASFRQDFSLHVNHLSQFAYVFIVNMFYAITAPPATGPALKFCVSFL